MKKIAKLILVFVVSILCLGCQNENQSLDDSDVKDNLSLNTLFTPFETLQVYDGNVEINQLKSTLSHSDQSETIEGVFEQDKYVITINPKNNEGKFSYSTSMYTLVDQKIMMLDGSDDVDLSYDLLLKDYVKDNKPYLFTLKDNKITKTKKSPSFYCEGCKGAYYGKTKSDTKAYVVDSFTLEDLETASGRDSIDEYKKYFDWIYSYITEIDNMKNEKVDSVTTEENEKRVNISSHTKNNQTIYNATIDPAQLSDYEKEDLLMYVNHQMPDIWDVSEYYIEIIVDDKGYPISFEKMIKAKHINTETIIPIFTKATFKL